MSKFFEDTLRGLVEAVEIEKDNVPLQKREGMPAPTYYVAENDVELIERLIEIRKKEHVSQTELADMTCNSQQSISRFEQKKHSSSMKMFSDIINALGYEVLLVKK